MLHISPAHTLKSKTTVVLALSALVGGIAVAAQDKYTLQIPNGLALSDFKGYEDWQDVAVSQTETGIKVIVANPVMMEAFKSGLPASGGFPRWLEDRQDRMDFHKEYSVTVFRKCA